MDNTAVTPTGSEILFARPKGALDFPRALYTPSQEAIAWDGAEPTTNIAIASNKFEGCYCYAQIKVTGRKLCTHRGGVVGLKCRVQFTGVDDTGEWVDAVLRIGPSGRDAPVLQTVMTRCELSMVNRGAGG